MAHEKTSFEWNGGPLQNVPVPAFRPADGVPDLRIKSLSVSIEDGHRGVLVVEFALGKDALLHRTRTAQEFAFKTTRALKSEAHSSTGETFSLTFSPICGKPMTELMMEKFILLMQLCGTMVVTPPRIVTETFSCDPREGHTIPFGTELFRKCLVAQMETAPKG